jgi:hypothetical protein
MLGSTGQWQPSAVPAVTLRRSPGAHVVLE